MAKKIINPDCFITWAFLLSNLSRSFSGRFSTGACVQKPAGAEQMCINRLNYESFYLIAISCNAVFINALCLSCPMQAECLCSGWIFQAGESYRNAAKISPLPGCKLLLATKWDAAEFFLWPSITYSFFVTTYIARERLKKTRKKLDKTFWVFLVFRGPNLVVQV